MPERQRRLRAVLTFLPPQGCTFWNTATVYGEDQHNEKLIGQVLREDSNRSKVVITTKWGLSSKGPDGEWTGHVAAKMSDH